MRYIKTYELFGDRVDKYWKKFFNKKKIWDELYATYYDYSTGRTKYISKKDNDYYEIKNRMLKSLSKVNNVSGPYENRIGNNNEYRDFLTFDKDIIYLFLFPLEDIKFPEENLKEHLLKHIHILSTEENDIPNFDDNITEIRIKVDEEIVNAINPSLIKKAETLLYKKYVGKASRKYNL